MTKERPAKAERDTKSYATLSKQITDCNATVLSSMNDTRLADFKVIIRITRKRNHNRWTKKKQTRIILLQANFSRFFSTDCCKPIFRKRRKKVNEEIELTLELLVHVPASSHETKTNDEESETRRRRSGRWMKPNKLSDWRIGNQKEESERVELTSWDPGAGLIDSYLQNRRRRKGEIRVLLGCDVLDSGKKEGNRKRQRRSRIIEVYVASFQGPNVIAVSPKAHFT